MGNETEKGKIELSIFKKFSELAGLDVIPESISKHNPPKPDICCQINGEGRVWFELTESCSPEFAEMINHLPESRVNFTWGSDNTEAILQKKIKKSYPIIEPIDLLIYTNGRTAMPDNALTAIIQHELSASTGQFRRIWFMGDNACQIWLNK